MKGKIIAANRNLGVIAVETEGNSCIVFEVSGLFAGGINVGEEIEGDWSNAGEVVLNNLVSGDTIQARVQRQGVSRSEAVGSLSIF